VSDPASNKEIEVSHISTVRHFEVLPSRIALFKAAFHCRGRLWNEISHGLPGHIVTHLIQNDQNPAKSLAFSFGNSVMSPCHLRVQLAAWDDIAMMNIMPGEEVIAEA
jgi:hypothetical protein